MRRLFALLLLVQLATTACASDNPDEASGSATVKPKYLAEVGAWDYYFPTLPEMVATSDLVIRGTVSGNFSVGRTLGDECPCLRVRNVELAVDEVFKGSVSAATVVLEEDGFDRSGAPYQQEGKPWSEARDTGVFFLIHSPNQSDGHYWQVTPDGRALVINDDVVNFAETPLGAELSRLEPDQLGPRVREAVAFAELNQIPAQETLSVLERPSADNPDSDLRRP